MITFDDPEGHDHPVPDVQILVTMGAMGGSYLREGRWCDGETVMQTIGAGVEH